MRLSEKSDFIVNEPSIIFEDKEILVLNKPSGWVVNRAATTKNQLTIQDWLDENFKFSRLVGERNGIVHRLDKETSGILLVAKTGRVFEFLQAQFKKRKVRKTYLALLHGILEPKKGEVNAPISRLPWDREKFGVVPGGRTSHTLYKVKKYYSDARGGKYSLVEFYPVTGRTHQIRVHAKYLGHPIVADEFYAGRKTAKKDRVWCKRLFLHASKIKFTHAGSKKIVSFSSSLPHELKLVLKTLFIVS